MSKGTPAQTRAPRAPQTRAEKDAARASKKAAAVVAVRDAEVGTMINQAGQAAQSMYTLARDAATKAASQLNPAKPLQERIAEVMSLYSADFTAAGHNVKAIFSDALTLRACAQTPVTVSVVAEGGKKVDKPMTAAEAVACSKHAMRDAAKQVREAMHIGRKSGGGRKSAPVKKIEAPKSAIAAQNAATTSASDVDQFNAWLDAADKYVTDGVYHARVVAHFITLGFTLSKAVKGRKIAGVAAA